MDKDKVIRKLEEIVNWLSIRLNDLESYDKYNQLQSELSALKSAKEENYELNNGITKTVYSVNEAKEEAKPPEEILYLHVNEAYLIECGIKDAVFEAMFEYASQFQSVQSKEEKPQFNYFQSRDLTDAEWLAMPKEEILQLYKNCYKLLMENFKSQPVQSVKGEGERTDDINQVENFAQILGRHALENKCFYTSNERHTCYDAFKEWLESYKHSKSQDTYPKEFVEWIGKEELFFETRYPNDPDNNKWVIDIKRSKGRVIYRTTDELLNHWSTVVTKR